MIVCCDVAVDMNGGGFFLCCRREHVVCWLVAGVSFSTSLFWRWKEG